MVTLRPRRAASARLDLSLALIAAGRHDEADGTALEAVTSGRLVPSNCWRAREVIGAVTARGVPEARELAEAYRAECPEPLALERTPSSNRPANGDSEPGWGGVRG
jgi:hypothetical protein